MTRRLIWLPVFTLVAIAGFAQTRYVEGVLSSTSDVASCDAQPAPLPHYTQRNHPNPDTPAASSCSDVGSTYQVTSGGRLYGLRRTSADAQREAQSLAVTGESNIGVLAFQPTGTHVLFLANGSQALVKLHERQSAYMVLFIR